MKTQQERWDEIVQRMKEKVDEGGRGSVSRLAELLNTERGTVSKYINGQLKGERVPADKILFFEEKLGLAPVLKRIGVHSPAEPVEGDNLPIIPVFSHAGAGSPSEFFSGTPEVTIPVLPQYFLPDIAAIKVTGDSMEPTISKGAYVGVVPLGEDLIEGGIYLVSRPPVGVLVKRVRLGKEGNILLYSDNPRYEPQELPFEGYEDVIIGKVVWVWQLF